MSRVEVVRDQLIEQDRYKGDSFIMDTCPNAFRLWEGGGTKPTPENEKKLREVLRIKEEVLHV